MNSKNAQRALGMTALMMLMLVGTSGVQAPADIAAGLQKIGPIVDPGWMVKLHRPANDVNSK